MTGQQIGTFNLSLKGTSHQYSGIECQDSSRVETLENGCIIAAIADGLGSAAHSKIGSQIAVDTVVDVFSSSKITRWDEGEIYTIFLSAFRKALELISNRAWVDGNNDAEYDTTLTSLIYNGDQVFFLHVGDGGVITLSKNGEFSVITTAQKGDGFNEVVPLRAGEEYWQFGVSKTGVCSILMMTDGIFDAACPSIYAHTSQPIRINYVRQFMDLGFMRLHGHQLDTMDDFQILQGKLERFYSGAGSSGISDDKTILGIINMSPGYLPAERDSDYYKDPDISSLIEEQNKRLYSNKEREAEVEKNLLDFKERGMRLHPVTTPITTVVTPIPTVSILPIRIVDYSIVNNRIAKKMKHTYEKIKKYKKHMDKIRKK